MSPFPPYTTEGTNVAIYRRRTLVHPTIVKGTLVPSIKVQWCTEKGTLVPFMLFTGVGHWSTIVIGTLVPFYCTVV